jgi:hypothetical protein
MTTPPDNPLAPQGIGKAVDGTRALGWVGGMNLRTITLIAAICVALHGVSMLLLPLLLYGNMGSPIYSLIDVLLLNVPLSIFLFTLYSKQN